MLNSTKKKINFGHLLGLQIGSMSINTLDGLRGPLLEVGGDQLNHLEAVPILQTTIISWNDLVG